MSSVTIKGSIMPCGFLARGEVTTVQLTPFVQRLIDQGFVDVVADAVPLSEGAVERVAPEPADPPTPPEVEPPKAPHKNASRDDWAEFLAPHPGGFITDGKGRDELVSMWEAYENQAPDQG